MTIGSREEQVEIEQDKTLNNINKCTTEIKSIVLKIDRSENCRGQGFMKRMKEAWDDIYKNSTMSA